MHGTGIEVFIFLFVALFIFFSPNIIHMTACIMSIRNKL